MVKKSLISVLSQKEKKDFQRNVEENQGYKDFQRNVEENQGSVEFQVFSLTNKIERLSLHLELHKKDYSSQRGLQKIVGKRQRLLAYLSKKNKVRYKELIGQLNIREKKSR